MRCCSRSLLFPFVIIKNVSVLFFLHKKGTHIICVPKCPHAPRGVVVCIPRRPRCVLVVARVARRFRTPRMSSSRTSLHRVRIIIIVKKESQQQTGGKKMLIGTSTTTSSKRDDASSRRREKREFFCWTRCSMNWTVTVRCSIHTRRVYRFSSSSHETRSMRGGTCRPLFFPL